MKTFNENKRQRITFCQKMITVCHRIMKLSSVFNKSGQNKLSFVSQKYTLEVYCHYNITKLYVV